MSIAYFTNLLYPDELVYSVLARAFLHGGYTSFKYAAEDFFINPKIRVEKEFIKNLKSEVVGLLIKDKSIEELIEKHTMYPLYGRFIARERRENAYQALTKGEGDFSKLFGVPNNKGEPRYLRYCPICSMEDREQFGETYWRRCHQLRGIEVCHKHKCYFLNGSVSLDSRDAVNLVSAEEVVPEELDIKICENPIEIRLAEYMVNVFKMPIDRNDETLVAKFLHAKLVGTPYISSRGEHKYYSKLWTDMKAFYAEVPLMSDITSGHIQRLLMGTRMVFEEICMVAMFLGIPADELARLETPLVSPEQEFDQEVMKLLDSGMSVNEAARSLGVAASIVRMVKVIDTKERVVQRRCNKSNNAIDWGKLDGEMITMVRQIIAEMHGDGSKKPRRISVYSVAKELNIPAYRLQRMDLCKKEIDLNRESDEKYYARKVKWALLKLNEEGKSIKMWRVCAVCKIEEEDIKRCLPELRKMAASELVSLLEQDLE